MDKHEILEAIRDCIEKSPDEAIHSYVFGFTQLLPDGQEEGATSVGGSRMGILATCTMIQIQNSPERQPNPNAKPE